MFIIKCIFWFIVGAFVGTDESSFELIKKFKPEYSQLNRLLVGVNIYRWRKLKKEIKNGSSNSH